MVGDVYVLSDPDYADWLAHNGASGTLVAQGHALFIRDGCDGCHGGHGTVRAPSLLGLYGSPVPLSDGTTVIADDAYIRDSNPATRQTDRRKLRSGHAVVRWRYRRGRPGETRRLREVAGSAVAARRKPAMSQAVADVGVLQPEMKSYLADGFSLRSWLLTTDHKRIAMLYMASITIFFFIGGAAAALMRYNLIVPSGMLPSAETYNRLFTMHGVIMVWFFLVPARAGHVGKFPGALDANPKQKVVISKKQGRYKYPERKAGKAAFLARSRSRAVGKVNSKVISKAQLERLLRKPLALDRVHSPPRPIKHLDLK